jgi:hypothetical protein
LIIGTLAPVVRYGTVILLYPVFMLFGCDGARSGADCLRILITPLVPIALTVIALIGCRLAVRRGWYLGSVLGAAVACGASWMVILAAADAGAETSYRSARPSWSRSR